MSVSVSRSATATRSSTMHMVDERVAVADLETLTLIYETFLARWFANAGT